LPEGAIPVVRISTSIRSPEQFTGEALGRVLKPLADAAPNRELQLDFDCPDRLLPVYADRLRAARSGADIRKLTITALAEWASVPGSEALWKAADAVYPMLYDVQADPPPPFQPRPLLDLATLRAQLKAWSACPIPWYAGLPVFARVTLFDAAGHSRGHLRAWDWEDLVFNPALLLDRPTASGVTVLKASKPTRAGESTVNAGDLVAVRGVEPADLQAGVAGAIAAGARGVVLFRLPDPPAPDRPTGGGQSLDELLALCGPSPAPTPRLRLARAAPGVDRWILRNDSDADLPPGFAAGARGYGLEMEIEGAIPGWREALPGDFRRVASHLVADAKTKPVPIALPLANRLTFWFAELPAHGALTTGLVQLAPGIDPSLVRFRLPAADSPESTPWQTPD
jgi:hypothetical protein